MFSAIGRYFRAIGYLATGRIDAARRAVSTDPAAIRATFDHVIRDKTRRINEYKDAIAKLIVQHEEKLRKVRQQTEEVNRLEQLQQGAAAKARQVVQQMQASGRNLDEIKASEDYKKCLAAYNDFAAKAPEKQTRISEYEADVERLDEQIRSHKLQLQEMLREIDTLREEQATTVAEVITAKEEEEINTMLAGISTDRSSRELQEMRQLREQVKAQARVSREMAGTDTKAQEAEFLKYATDTQHADEFDRLIGLAGEADREANEPMQREPRLPE